MLNKGNKSIIRVISIFLSYLIIITPTVALADTPTPSTVQPETSTLGKGRVRNVSRGQHAPFSGILLDNIAAAKTIVDRKYADLRYKLKLDFEIKKISLQYELKIGNLQASFDGLQSMHTDLLSIKNNEISRLQEVIKDSANNNSTWYAVGGFILGAVLSVGIFYAAVETSK